MFIPDIDILANFPVDSLSMVLTGFIETGEDRIDSRRLGRGTASGSSLDQTS